MTLVVLLSLFALSTATLQCPQISCVSLPLNICAQRNDPYKLSLEIDPCSADRECHIVSVFAWLNSGDTNNLYYCQKKPLIAQSASSYTGTRYCLKREVNKDFKGGVTLVTCSLDSDCVLDDNTYDKNSCVCGVRGDGKGICNPNISSTAFQGLWDACGTDNTIKTEATYEYWMFYVQMWVYTQSTLECVKNMYEMQELTILHDHYSNFSPLFLLPPLLLASF